MASTYENDLRLEEMATGENSGSWGTKTNTNLELIADAFSYGTETIADADTTITIADGAADAARSLALKINSSEDLTTTRVVTLAPNTTSKVWIIENNTSGGQTLTISAGSGSNITLANGTTKIIATDGIGAGSNVVELTQDLAIADMSVDGILSLADGTNSAPSLTNTGDTNTGLYFPAADEVGITVGGTQVFKADSTGVDVTGAVTATTSTDQAFPLTVSNTDSDSNTYIKYLDNGGQFWSTGINYANNDFYFNYNGSFIGRFLNAGGLELTRADNDAVLIIKSTDADANDGPIFDLIRDSSSPADNDGIGSIRWKADDSAGNETQYADIRVFTDDVTDGTEDVNFTLRGIRNGTLVSRLAFNASEMVINDSSNDVDFRVESDNNANMLFVDAGNDQVVVGDNGNYFSKFTVVGGKTRSTGIPLNQLSVYDNSAMASSTGGAITLWGKYTTGGAQAEGASIEAYKSNGTSGNYQYGMWLKTRTHGGSMDDRLFMDQAQTVFNETGANTDFRVESDSNANMLFVDAGDSHVNIGSSTAHGVLGVQQGASAGVNATTLGLNHVHASNKYIDFKWYNSSIMNIAQEGGSNIGINWSNTLAFNSSEVNSDFRIASDSISHLFAIDASENRVSIGGTNFNEGSGYIFNVRGGTSRFANPAADVTIRIEGGAYTNPHRARLTLTGGYGDTGRTRFWHIDGQAHGGGGNVYNDLRFSYEVTNSATLYEVLRFNKDGQVIVNEDGRGNVDFRVESDNATHALFVEADSAYVKFGKSADTTGEKVLGVMIGCQSSSANGRIGSTSESPSWFSKYGVNGDLIKFHKTDGTNLYNVGSISVTTIATAYNTSSDHRLKENVVDLTGATARLNQLAPKRFNFIADDTTTVDGFIAHEVQSIVPEAITGTHNEVDDDGNPVYQGIDQSKLVPLLVATIKELEARITALENA
jgi:hypothetical protein